LLQSVVRGLRCLRDLLLLAAVVLILAPLLVVALPIVAVTELWRRVVEGRLTRQFRTTYGRAGKFVVFVYSNSPNWQERIESEVLPKLEPYAIVLNWSERSTPRWKSRPLEVRIFQVWGGSTEFNPIAILIPPTGSVETFRFWRAYRDFRHGKPVVLKEVEEKLFARVGEIAKKIGHV